MVAAISVTDPRKKFSNEHGIFKKRCNNKINNLYKHINENGRLEVQTNHAVISVAYDSEYCFVGVI